MLNKGVTLRGLEVFEALANSGSVAQTAKRTGLSQPAVSQQLRNLEKALSTDLINHDKRPMTLTAAGRSFLSRTEAVLSQLRLAQSELTVMDLTHLSKLSIGLIDDFDNDLTPRLVTILAESMTKCQFKLITAPSLDINAAMKDHHLHIAVAASTGQPHDSVVEYPLVQDPFILVTPRGMAASDSDIMSSLVDVPFLRYAREQLISQQIEVQLTQQGMQYEKRFEIGSHLALMAMVARRIGWAITTPLGYMRAARFHDDIEAHALPFGEFSRVISLFSRSDWADRVPLDVAQTMRQLVQNQIIDPAVSRLPWLAGSLQVIEA
ncbi:MAG: LysR family transcriptional regulator [Rhodobacteraceae bacterium]|nr:LysR family transcriptional regulator [Paracoccaceae bacterium]